MRPLLTYYGGKQRLADKIVSMLPKHHHYIEPFAGGAAVFFAKGVMGPPSRYTETLNDINGNIIAMYRAFQSPTTREQLCERLRWTPHSLSEWRRAREICRDPDASELDKAWATLVFFNQSFSGTGEGWASTRNIHGQRALSWRNRVRLLMEELQDRLDHVQLECRDALYVIDKYDCEGACFYCDPPYPGYDQGPYAGYTQADFEQLVARLESCQASVVLSCYENDAVPDHWDRVDVRTRASSVAGMQVDERRVEVLWRIDRTNEPQLRLFCRLP